MRAIAWAVCGLVIGMAYLSAPRQSAGEVPKGLQGTWATSRAERDGKGADDVIGHRLSVDGDRFQIRSRDGKPLYAGLVRADPGAKPAAIDLSIPTGP